MFTGYTDQTVDVFWGIRFNNEIGRASVGKECLE